MGCVIVQAMQVDRDYRQVLTGQALVFIAGEELEVTVRNISLTGLYAELDESRLLKNPDDLVKSLKKNPIIDLLFEKLDFAGEAKATRVERGDGKISIAMEFKNITYGVSTRLYRRNVYRKSFSGTGYIQLNARKIQFKTHNVSVEGLLISIPKRVSVKRNTVAKFIIQQLKLKGKARVIWTEPDEKYGLLLGLQYVNLEKSLLAGKIPTFTRSKNK